MICIDRVTDTEAGWVTPGQMTALMGVSGAGKVPTLNDKIFQG